MSFNRLTETKSDYPTISSENRYFYCLCTSSLSNISLKPNTLYLSQTNYNMCRYPSQTRSVQISKAHISQIDHESGFYELGGVLGCLADRELNQFVHAYCCVDCFPYKITVYSNGSSQSFTTDANGSLAVRHWFDPEKQEMV